MMFFFLMTAALVANFWMLWRIRKLKSHDEVLYKYCALRRQAMQYLRDEEKSSQLSRQDYIALRKMIELMNFTIERYKDHKLIMFNLRRFVRFLRAYKSANRETEAITVTNNDEIEALRKGILGALFFGFMTYTPFIKSELAVRVSIFLLGMLAKAGVKRVNRYIASLKEVRALSHAYYATAC